MMEEKRRRKRSEKRILISLKMKRIGLLNQRGLIRAVLQVP